MMRILFLLTMISAVIWAHKAPLDPIKLSKTSLKEARKSLLWIAINFTVMAIIAFAALGGLK